ncbi:hypothetical protein [Methylobacterium sp. GC_Met_2]|uniref:hypothetical protein n=1 Tax=Methylobacterium sp. GC_Met_2 TaxID=2937376 RepID=UPI00226BBACB|nr:hypothetical protein [Methylobacterium sp. GC_Met_2]
MSELPPQGHVLGVQLAGVYRQLHTLLLRLGKLLPKLGDLELEREAFRILRSCHRRRSGTRSSASTPRLMPLSVPASEARKAAVIIPPPAR